MSAARPSRPSRGGELRRFVVNGLVATAVHYGVLRLNLEVLGFRSAGLANLCAAGAGIGASFLGSRYYVFAGATRAAWAPQLLRFAGLYALTALLHGSVLWLWTDRSGLDWRSGFVTATLLQVALSYIGNRRLVFRP